MVYNKAQYLDLYFFLLYINELSNVSSLLHAILFADDTTFYVTGHDLTTISQVLNNELIKIQDWLNLNRLSLNINKTNFMVFRVRQKRYDPKIAISICNRNITEAKNVKFLGLKIDPHLNWNEHIDFISNKISKGTGILHRVNDCLPSKCLRQLYYSFIYPYLNYCALVWMNTSKTNKIRLLRLQKKAVRSIYHKPYNEHSLPLFKRAKILPVHDLPYFRGSIYLFKNKKGP